MLSHLSPLQWEKLADFRFGSARILGQETDVLVQNGAGRQDSGKGRAVPK
jgi:hypothetical protein